MTAWFHYRVRGSNHLLWLFPYLLRKKEQEFSKDIGFEPELARNCSESWYSGRGDRQIDKLVPQNIPVIEAKDKHVLRERLFNSKEQNQSTEGT